MNNLDMFDANINRLVPGSTSLIAYQKFKFSGRDKVVRDLVMKAFAFVGKPCPSLHVQKMVSEKYGINVQTVLKRVSDLKKDGWLQVAKLDTYEDQLREFLEISDGSKTEDPNQELKDLVSLEKIVARKVENNLGGFPITILLSEYDLTITKHG